MKRVFLILLVVLLVLPSGAFAALTSQPMVDETPVRVKGVSGILVEGGTMLGTARYLRDTGQDRCAVF